MTDPLLPIFEVPCRRLFESRELVVSHGPLERLPRFMREGAMQSVDALCRSYAGAIEIANGSVGDGLQTSVSGVHPTALLKLGLTVYFQEMRRTLPASSDWLRTLEASLGLPECASIIAFANAPGSGLALHHDRYDQLLFQIRGTKRFQYGRNRYVEAPDLQFSPFAPAHHDFGRTYAGGFPLTSAEVMAEPLTTVELQPGSAFFMPSGTWHATAEQPSESLSLVVAVRAPSRLDVLQNLLAYYAGQAPEWRARTYGGWSSSAADALPVEQALSRLMTDLCERLKSVPASDAFKAWLAHGFALGSQTDYPSTLVFERYIRLPNSSVQFEDDARLGKLRCTVLSGAINRPQAQITIAMEHEARPVLDWILQTHAAFTVSELCDALPDYDGEEVAQLLVWLSRAALIRPVPGPRWAPPSTTE